MSKDKPAEEKSPAEASGLKVNWDASNMSTSYANVVNSNSTREEVSVFFGTNQTWNGTDSKELTVELDNRIVLNPYAAKRLSILLARVVADYESKHGEMNLGAAQQ
ncbi:MAG: DUF3467 domain-containing protein [Halioglobus sp.]